MDLLQSKQKKEEQAHQKTIAYIKLLYKIKNSIKINSFILYFAFIFKFLGLVLISHIFDSNKNNLELDTLIRKITSCYNSDISCINLPHQAHARIPFQTNQAIRSNSKSKEEILQKNEP